MLKKYPNDLNEENIFVDIKDYNFPINKYGFCGLKSVKSSLVPALKELLSQYRIKIATQSFNGIKYSRNNNEFNTHTSVLGYLVRNKVIYIADDIPTFTHELAHIALVKNTKRLDIDNFGMVGAHNVRDGRRWLPYEAKVWGMEQSITGDRQPNKIWQSICKLSDQEFNNIVNPNIEKYSNISNEEILFRLKKAFDYITQSMEVKIHTKKCYLE